MKINVHSTQKFSQYGTKYRVQSVDTKWLMLCSVIEVVYFENCTEYMVVHFEKNADVWFLKTGGTCSVQ